MIEWPATLRAEMLNVAWAEPFRVSVPNVVEPSLNVTVPVGAPELDEVTLAVKVTDWPKTAGLAEEVTAVDEAAGLAVRTMLWPVPPT